MKKSIFAAKIAGQACTAQGFYRISIHVPGFFLQSKPGQFVMIQLKDCASAFLARPISIHSIYRKSRRVVCDLLYQVVGQGTRALSGLKKGDEVLVNGPLGKGFETEDLPDRVILIAGGMGIAPLGFAAEKIRSASAQKTIICYQGARNRDLLPDIPGLDTICNRLVIGTDDGSAGRKGFVTDLFEEDLASHDDRGAIVFACGPHEMLRSLKRKLQGRQIPCRVSVEEKMACGVGACLGCAIRMKSGGYRCACCDGPVFDLNDLDLENDK